MLSRIRQLDPNLVQWVLWAMLVAEAALVAFLQKPWLTNDSVLYLELARNLSGQGFVSLTPAGLAPDAVRAPGYPIFLNLTLFRLGLPPAAVIAIQMLLYLASIWLFAHRVIRSNPLRTVFLGAAVLYVFPLFYAASFLSEAVAMLFVALIAALLSRPARNSLVTAVAAGALVGAGALVRTDILPVIAAVVLVIVWRSRKRPLAALAAGASAVAAAALVLLPYMLWNQRNFGQLSPVPVASVVGQSLYLASWESRLALQDLMLISGGPVTREAVTSGLAAEVGDIHADAAKRAPYIGVARNFPHRQLEVAQSKAYLDAALRRIQADPVVMVAHLAEAPWRLFNTSEYPPAPWPAILILRLISGAALIAGVAGAVLAARRRTVSLAPFAVAVCFLVPHLPLHTEARYTAPLRLIVLFYAAVALYAAWRAATQSAKHPSVR